MKTIEKHHNLCYVFTFLLFVLPVLGSAQVISKAPQDLFIIGSESINFKSKITNSAYKLYVNLPENYDPNSTKTYPVFYALDGNRTFDIATRVYKGMWDDGFAPEIIIIGVTYGGTKENPTLHRSRDLTPTAIARIQSSGGAPKFLKVFRDEIIPLIDRLYKSDTTNRTLAGTSFAGLFAHYTLFTAPSLFQNYIINNPTFWWDKDYAYMLEEAFYQKNKSLNAKVMFSSGEFDDIPKVIKMVEQVKKHNYTNMTLDFRRIENMGHLGGEAEAMNQGMRFVYKRPTIMLPEEVLSAYCGTYKDGNYVREIIVKDGELSLIRKGALQGVKIHAMNKSKFAILGRYFDFNFNRNEKGKVISFTSQQDTDSLRSRTAIKIK